MRSAIVRALVSSFVVITVAGTDTRTSADAVIQEFLERLEPAVDCSDGSRRHGSVQCSQR
jgi:hypothetical protein